MRTVFLQCPWCNQNISVFFDSDSGLWEIRQGFSKISNRSLGNLERDWLKARHPNCVKQMSGVDELERIAVAPAP